MAVLQNIVLWRETSLIFFTTFVSGEFEKSAQSHSRLQVKLPLFLPPSNKNGKHSRNLVNAHFTKLLEKFYIDIKKPIGTFLGASQNCEKRLLASSCLSVHMKQLSSRWTDSHETWYLGIFSDICQVNSSSNKNKRVLYMKTYLHLRQFLAEFLWCAMFRTKFVQKIKTRFLYNNFFPKIVPFMR
jgi:hypothetical protein